MNLYRSIAIFGKSLVADKLFLPVLYGIIGIAAILSYAAGRNIMIAHKPWLYIVQSNITLNFILFFFMWGIVCDRITKGRSKRIQWMVFLAGLSLMIVFFRFVGGYSTIAG